MRSDSKRPGAAATATGPGLSIVANARTHSPDAPAGQSPAGEVRQQHEGVLFEQVTRQHVWRFQETEWQGQRRLQVWPWYRSKEGELRPCHPKFGGGFAIPHARLPELLAALAGVIEGQR